MAKKADKSKHITISIPKYVLGPALLIAILFIPFVVLAKQNQDLRKQSEEKSYVTPTPITKPTKSPTPTTKPTAKPVTRAIQPTVEADPPVHCNISDHCGGGTRPLKQSECDNMTCCQTKDGWEFISKTKCDSLHGSYDKEIEKVTSRTALFVGGFTRYCDESAHSAIKDSYAQYEKTRESDKQFAEQHCNFLLSTGQIQPDGLADCYNQQFSLSNLYYSQYLGLISTHCN